MTLFVAAWSPAPASALVVAGLPADAVSGTALAPAGTVLTVMLEAAPGTPVPASIALAVGNGLRLGGPQAPACAIATVRADPAACPDGSEIGDGWIELTSSTVALRVFNLEGGTSLALTVRGIAPVEVADLVVATLDPTAQTLTVPFGTALRAAARGATLTGLRLRLGGSNTLSDWVRSERCPGGAWSLSAALLAQDGGTIDAGAAPVACRPPRTALLGKFTPSFLLSQTGNGRARRTRILRVQVPPGLPADATVIVTCRAGCRGSARARVPGAGRATAITLRPSMDISSPRSRIEVAVATRSVRGRYLVIAFRRGADRRVTGWSAIGRGCIRLGSAPARVTCLK